MNSKVLYPTLVVAWLVAAGFTTAPPADGDVGGSVADSATGTPLPGGEVRILRGGNTIAATTTDAFGRYVIHNVPAGSYSVEVRYLGYRSDTQDRKSTRLNSSHGYISYAVFCLKKKNS